MSLRLRTLALRITNLKSPPFTPGFSPVCINRKIEETVSTVLGLLRAQVTEAFEYEEVTSLAARKTVETVALCCAATMTEAPVNSITFRF